VSETDPEHDTLNPFLDLSPTKDPLRFSTVAAPRICVGRPDKSFLFGGGAFAACIEAVEQAVGLPINYASTQFISFARPGEAIDLSIRLVADGRNLKQVQVDALVEDRHLLSMQAAAGTRQIDLTMQGITMPAVPPPNACTAIPITRILSARIERLFELRPALGRLAHDGPWQGPAGGPVAFWARARGGQVADRRLLTELADFIAIGLPSALGLDTSANSLDNHIRFGLVTPSEWTLCTISIDWVYDGLVHGTVHLFSPDGVLMAIASQTMILRLWRAARQS
jgi:acyl-CoA thioesterase-2